MIGRPRKGAWIENFFASKEIFLWRRSPPQGGVD